MSPTRRDFLKVMIAMPVVALIPANANAAPSPVINPTHLTGIVTAWNYTKDRLYWSRFEIFTDERTTAFRVSNLLDETEWEEIVYTDPAIIDAFRQVAELLQLKWETPKPIGAA